MLEKSFFWSSISMMSSNQSYCHVKMIPIVIWVGLLQFETETHRYLLSQKMWDHFLSQYNMFHTRWSQIGGVQPIWYQELCIHEKITSPSRGNQRKMQKTCVIWPRDGSDEETLLSSGGNSKCPKMSLASSSWSWPSSYPI